MSVVLVDEGVAVERDALHVHHRLVVSQRHHLNNTILETACWKVGLALKAALLVCKARSVRNPCDVHVRKASVYDLVGQHKKYMVRKKY